MIKKLLGQHGIPSPTTLIAQLIALKIAALPADPSAPYKGQGVQELETRDGKKLLVWIKDGNHISSNQWSQVECRIERDSIVTFDEEDSAPIIAEFRAYRHRSIKCSKLNQEARNQDRALGILEKIV